MLTVTLLFGAFHTLIAFSISLLTVSAAFASAEFTMGLVDSGCNIICLKLWGERRAGPFFTALHLFFGIGNILGPVLVEVFLGDDESGGKVDFLGLTYLQLLHLFIGGLIASVALLFFVAIVTTTVESQSFSTECVTASESPVKTGKDYAVISLLTVFFCIANGVNFAYTNYLTVFASRSRLQLPSSSGARATTLYFTAASVMKLATVFAIVKISAIFLLLFDLLLLQLGASILLLWGESDKSVFYVGTVLVGLGVSTLFSSGAIWLRQWLGDKMSSRVTAAFIISTSLGAQCFKIPLAPFIESTPLVLIYSLCSASSLVTLLFCSAAFIATRLKSNSETLAIK